MILKKEEKNNKIKAIYSSSTICASIFNTETKDLIVIFNNGGQYKYPNVGMTDYTRFELAESNGTVFNNYIKKNYSNYEKLDKIDVSSILKEIDELSNINAKPLENNIKDLIKEMDLLISNYVSTGNFNHDILTNVKNKISEYDNLVNIKNSKKIIDN